ncbi:MAG: nitroreductase family protein [Dehalococcoidia bacterium]|nr:nitroreductase family protein [Dehalococcoidia bacterium]
MDLFEAVKARRSVRRMKTVPLPPGALETILEAGRLAPSWANTQCWQLVVVDDPALKASLVDELARIPNRATDAVRNAPVTIAVCAETGKAGFYKGAAATDKGEYWYMFDTALLVENMCLAAAALGLGSVIIGLYDHKKVAGILGLPAGTVSVCLLPIGYPDDAGTTPRTPRRPLGEFVFRNRYGVKYW